MGKRYPPEEYDRQNLFIQAHYNKDMTAEQIGAHLKIPRNTVIQRAARLGIAKTNLAKQKSGPTSLNPTKTITYQNITLPRLSILENDDEGMADDPRNLQEHRSRHRP